MRFIGEFDMATGEHTEEIAGDALRHSNANRFVIDMAETTFCDSSGLALLVRITDAAREQGREARTAKCSTIVRGVIEVTNLAALLGVEP